MPLPAALQQRLMQRGLIKTSAQGEKMFYLFSFT